MISPIVTLTAAYMSPAATLYYHEAAEVKYMLRTMKARIHQSEVIKVQA
jgi:hypothetical protein